MPSVKKLLLIIDDDPDILEALVLMLEESGYRTASSTRAEDVFTLVDKTQPDLLILDVLLSGSDGRTLVKKLKSEDHLQHIPVIMISAHPSARISVFESGADDFLPKPFDVSRLIEKIETHLTMQN